jgi:hypothetical protein
MLLAGIAAGRFKATETRLISCRVRSVTVLQSDDHFDIYDLGKIAFYLKRAGYSESLNSMKRIDKHQITFIIVARIENRLTVRGYGETWRSVPKFFAEGKDDSGNVLLSRCSSGSVN